MNVDIQSPSNVEKKVTIRIPAARLTEERTKVLSELSRYAAIKGFRPGKAPQHLIEKMYGPAILDEVRQRLFRDTVEKVLTDNKLQPISQPKVDAQEPKLGQDYEFSLQFEVRPEFELKEYLGLDISQKPEPVSDDDVQQALENLRQNNAVLVANEKDTELGSGLFFVGNYTGTIGDRQVSSNGKDVEIEMGAKGQLPGLTEKLEGLKKGESRLVELKVPEDWTDESIRGKDYRITFTLTAIKRRVLPDLDDEFAKDLEVESLDALKKKVRGDLEQRNADRAKQEGIRKLLELLVDRNPVDAPPSLVEAQAQEYVERTRYEFQMRGFAMNPDEAQMAEMKKSVRENAERAVKRALILSAVAAKEKIEVADADLEAELRRNAESSNLPYEKLRALYEKENMLEAVRAQLREQKTVDFLVEKAKK